MAIGTPALAVAAVGATGLTVTTASFTPTAGDLLIALPVSRGTGATMPTMADSLGETWTPFDSGSSLTACKSRLQWKIATANAQTVTVTTTGGTQTAIVIVRVSGAGTDFTNYKVDSHATTTTRAVTMDAFAAGSGCIYLICASAGTGWAVPTGYTEVYDGAPATNARIAWGYDITLPATAISSLGGGVDSTMYGIELKPPVGGGDRRQGLDRQRMGGRKPVKVWTGSAWVTKPAKLLERERVGLMAFRFSGRPTVGQQYAPAGGPVYRWNGSAWAVLQGVPSSAHMSDTAPLDPEAGQLWWDSDSGNLFIWYVDADSAQWVQVSGSVAPVGTAETRNRVVNGAMQHSQELGPGGTQGFTNYAVDQWQHGGSVAGSTTTSLQSATANPPSGNKYALASTISPGKPSLIATDLYYICQPIEGGKVLDFRYGMPTPRRRCCASPSSLRWLESIASASGTQPLIALAFSSSRLRRARSTSGSSSR